MSELIPPKQTEDVSDIKKLQTLQNRTEQFNAVLMFFIHDIKNSLLMSLSSLENLYYELDQLPDQQKQSLTTIQYELRRINNALIQLLSLYKMQTSLFSVHIDQYNVYDFLDELIINNQPLNSQNGIQINLQCDEELDWFFDRDLIATLINSSVNNAIRYAQNKILLSAQINNNQLEITIEDDGDGFPKKMFTQEEDLETIINSNTGSTGLGLYFARKIASLHKNREKQGLTKIDNQSSLGGGRFLLFLP